MMVFPLSVPLRHSCKIKAAVVIVCKIIWLINPTVAKNKDISPKYGLSIVGCYILIYINVIK
jgi:hypothetical protein